MTSARKWIEGIIRWTARASGTLVAGVFLLFLVGEGLGPRGVYTLNPFVLSASTFLVIFLRLIACLGLLLAWRWAGLGGILAVVCIAIATVLRPWVLIMVLAIAVPGLLHLLSWFLSRHGGLRAAH